MDLLPNINQFNRVSTQVAFYLALARESCYEKQRKRSQELRNSIKWYPALTCPGLHGYHIMADGTQGRSATSKKLSTVSIFNHTHQANTTAAPSPDLLTPQLPSLCGSTSSYTAPHPNKYHTTTSYTPASQPLTCFLHYYILSAYPNI